ncbi:MAG: MFS transporter [Thiohalocapsa sp.]
MPKPTEDTAPPTLAVWPLAVAQTLSWASIYYIFPALLPEWEQELGWSRAFLSSAFTGTLLVSASCALLIGLLIDRGHSKALMVWSSLLGAFCLLGLSTAQQPWQFAAWWLLLGVAQAGALYEACFAVITRAIGARAKRAITLVTLVGGFAGTLSFPTAHALAATLGWRMTLVCFAGFMIISAIITAFALARVGSEPAHAPGTGTERGTLARQMQRPMFWLLALAAIMMSLNHATILTHLLPILADRGLAGNTAILAASMIGPMQITGRLAMMAAGERSSSMAVSIASFVAMALASLALLGTAMQFELVVVFVLLQGAGHGVTSITRPVIIGECFGHRNYGAIAGALAFPLTTAAALAPTLGAMVWSLGGYDLVLAFTFCAALIGCVSMLLIRRIS